MQKHDPLRQDFECFLPLAENPYQRRSKKHRQIIEPLFPRYLFLNAIAGSQNLAPVRSTRGVTGIVAERNSATRTLILMELLGRETKVQVDSMLLQVL